MHMRTTLIIDDRMLAENIRGPGMLDRPLACRAEAGYCR
jgi:hypothetical protein